MAFTQTQLQSMHYDPAVPTGWDLRLCETVYNLVVRGRLQLYRAGILKTQRLPVPVISVGNLTTGGTGKTPVVIALARHLESRGLMVAVLSRGYKARIPTAFHEATSVDYGDEAFMIQQHLSRGKVYVGKNRVYTGKMAIASVKPDVIILDDGFQHVRLHRDLNILLVDGEKGFGNQHLLPAGPLREPITQLARADGIMLTKTITPHHQQRLETLLAQLNLDIPVYLCPFEATGVFYPASGENMPPDVLGNTSLVLLSGIAQPDQFETMVTQHIGSHIQEHFIFSDHKPFSIETLEPVVQHLEAHPQTALVTTEKDWVKLQLVLPLSVQPRVWVMRIAPVFEWDTLLNRLQLPFATEKVLHE